MAKQIITAQVADGDSAEFKVFGDSLTRYRSAMLYITGDLGGGTISFKAKAPDDSLVPFAPIADITAAGAYVLSTPPFIGVLTLTGATAPNINAWLVDDNDTVRKVTV